MDMHKLAERVELEELKKMGLLQGEVDQMMEVCTCVSAPVSSNTLSVQIVQICCL